MRTLLAQSMAIVGWTLTAGCNISVASTDKPSGPVLDLAKIIPPEVEQRLDQELREYHERTGRALVVATTPSLESESIERYSTAMANRLGIGDRKTNQGLMLLIAPNERKVRIEVGLGLEKTITDQIADDILKQAVLPRFRNSDMIGGIDEGVDALIHATECRLANGVRPYCPEGANR